MTHFNATLKTNPLQSRQDYVDALGDLIRPVYQLMQAEGVRGRVRISDSGTVYDERRREIEGFLRTLWGVGPLCNTQARAQAYREFYQPATAGILAGCDPQSPDYWGELEDYDQLFVEMGSLATFLILTRTFFYQKLPASQQAQIVAWLDQINHHKIPKTNWLFFRVLVNTFFQHVGVAKGADQIGEDLAALDGYYLADGWYFDGYENQIDYYIPFALQYYGVLYTQLAADANEPHVAEFAKRAFEFAKTFKDWFVHDGTALPFGRSQTYRFAQSAFWAVQAFAKHDMDGVSAAEGKYLLAQNMHAWFQLPIFTSDNFLSIGYGYPNLVFAEGYNGAGSPYWALKNFIVLALPDDDDFWRLAPAAPSFPAKVTNPYSRMLLVHGDAGKELQAFTAGQHSHEHAHGEDKYEKFAYSTTFGFSVKKGSVLPKQGAFDNTLVLSEGTVNFQTPFGYSAYAIHDDYVYSRWQPWADVTIDTFVIPEYPWHIRLHLVHSGRALHFLIGSFSAPDGGQAVAVAQPQSAVYHSAAGTVGIVGLTPALTATLSEPEPNTNVFFPKTVLPLLAGQIAPGDTQIIIACLGDAHHATEIAPIAATLAGDRVTITIGTRQFSVLLEELD